MAARGINTEIVHLNNAKPVLRELACTNLAANSTQEEISEKQGLNPSANLAAGIENLTKIPDSQSLTEWSCEYEVFLNSWLAESIILSC